MTGRRGGPPAAGSDQGTRWHGLLADYPGASYTLSGDGWFYGALRDGDLVMRAASLERLAGMLEAREAAR